MENPENQLNIQIMGPEIRISVGSTKIELAEKERRTLALYAFEQLRIHRRKKDYAAEDIAKELFPNSNRESALVSVRVSRAKIRDALREYLPMPLENKSDLRKVLEGAYIDAVAFTACIGTGTAGYRKAITEYFGGILLEGWEEVYDSAIWPHIVEERQEACQHFLNALKELLTDGSENGEEYRALARRYKVLLPDQAQKALEENDAKQLANALLSGANRLKEGTVEANVPQPIVPVTLPATPPSRMHLRYRHNPRFVGREEAIAELHTLLTEHRRAAIVGMGGLGKTQLAIEYAYAHLMDYRGGIFWVNAIDDRQLLEDFALIGRRYFGLHDDTDQERQAERLGEELERLEQPALLILDNVTDDTRLSRLPASAPLLHVLLTTKLNVLPEDFAAATLRPAPLDEAAALSLLQTHACVQGAKEQNAARSIVRLVGCLPLALALAASHIRALGSTFEEYHEKLAANPHHTLQSARKRFLAVTPHDGNLYDTIDLTYVQLDANAIRVFAAAACFDPRDISTELLRAASGFSPEQALDFDEALADLWSRSLLDYENRDEALEGPRRVYMHELVREFARVRLDLAMQQAALVRTTAALAHCLEAANRAMDWHAARREVAHCQVAEELCREQDTPPPPFGDLLREMGAYFYEHRNLDEAHRLLYDANDLIQPQPDSEAGQARVLHLLAVVCQDRGDPERARQYARAAWRLAQRLQPPDPSLTADCCNDGGYILRRQNRFGLALLLYNHAKKIYEAVFGRNHQHVAMCLSNIGVVKEEQGDLNGALEDFEAALEKIRLESPQHVTVALYLNHIGRVEGKQGKWEEALGRHEEAETISKNAYDDRHPDVGASLFYQAEACRRLDEKAKARMLYEAAQAIYERAFGANHRVCKMIDDRLDEMGG